MSSFHPLGQAAKDSHPLTARTAAALPFHHDDEDTWTPPALPGEASALGSGGGGGRRGNASSSRSGTSLRSPLEQAPLHPLLSSSDGGSLSAGDTSADLGSKGAGNGRSGRGGDRVGHNDNPGRRAEGLADSRVDHGFGGPTPAWGAGAVGGRPGVGGVDRDEKEAERRVAVGRGGGGGGGGGGEGGAGRPMAAGANAMNGGGLAGRGGFGGGEEWVLLQELRPARKTSHTGHITIYLSYRPDRSSVDPTLSS